MPSSDVRTIGQYEVGITLGKGLQGKVKEGTHLKTGEKVALKLIDKSKLAKGSRELKNLKREVAAMEALEHPNIVRMKEVEWDAVYPKKDGTTMDVILIVLELATGGELFDFMMYTGCFPEGIARAYFQQLVAAIEHCHTKGLAHRDLKPENLLLTSDFLLKVADFGLAALSEEEDGTPILLRTECGTRGYMAPEVLSRKPYDGPNADIWSIGVVLFIMLAGFPPFQIAAATDWWFARIRNKQYPLFWEAHMRVTTFSKGAMDLLSKIFVANPAERATIEDIKAHEWFKTETVSSATLSTELHRRMVEVHAQKRREREEEERKRAAASAGATFDPFSRATVRAVHTDADGKAEEAEAAAPPLPDTVIRRYTMFYSKEGPKRINERLAQAFSAMAAVYKADDEGYRMKATVNTTTGQQVKLTTRVYSAGDMHVVDVQRRAGDLFKFQEVYRVMCEAVGDLITAPPALSDAAASKTAEVPETTTAEASAESGAAEAAAVDEAADALGVMMM